MRRINFGFKKPPKLTTKINFGDQISNGLTALYLFNEGGGLKAQSLTNKFNGTLVNGPSWAACKFGTGINFNASAAYVAIGNPLLGSSFTLAMWVNITTLAVNKQFMGTFQAAGGGWLWRTATSDATLIQFYDGAANHNSGSVLSTGSWFFIAVTRSGGNYNFYFNGLSILSEAGSAPVTNTQVRIADVPEGDAAPGAYDLDGKIDNVRIYTNRALSASEIMRLYREPFAGLLTPKIRKYYNLSSSATSGGILKRKQNSRAIDYQNPVNKRAGLNRGLVSWWLTTPTPKGGRFYDLMKKNDATLTSSPTWQATRRPGGYGGIYCTGGSYFSFPLPVVNTTDDFTIMFWIYPVSWPGAFTAMVDDSGRSFFTTFVNQLGNGSGFGGAIVSGADDGSYGMTTGSWWHFCYTRLNGTVKAFVNGVERDSASNSSGSGFGRTIVFGNNISGGGSNADAVYDDIKWFFQRGMNVDEVLRHYQASSLGYPNELNRIRRRSVFQTGSVSPGNNITNTRFSIYGGTRLSVLNSTKLTLVNV